MSQKKRQKSSIFTLGLSSDRDYFLENLSMLVAAGMPIVDTLDAINKEVRSSRMKQIISLIREDIESGSTIWNAFEKTGLFPEHSISLIRLGESSGKLMENLKVISTEQQKNREFKSKIRSAVMYPVFVMSLTAIIGVGISWFILPKLSTVFIQMKIELPLITRMLIGAGNFLGLYGHIVIPSLIALLLIIFFFIFVFAKTKFIGQYLILHIPGVSSLMREVEIARFGYLLGTLLKAGLPITQALDSLANSSEIFQYKKFYTHIRTSVEDGNSLQKSFSTYVGSEKLIPIPIQHLILVGEQSGSLADSFIRIGETFESKADLSTKNLAVILEPVLLIIVWLGVVAVALAVILPIYSLIGGFKTS
jgi:type IV pilus assembly protein PilC